jgi:hypothetical protein
MLPLGAAKYRTVFFFGTNLTAFAGFIVPDLAFFSSTRYNSYNSAVILLTNPQ